MPETPDTLTTRPDATGSRAAELRHLAHTLDNRGPTWALLQLLAVAEDDVAARRVFTVEEVFDQLRPRMKAWP